MYYPHLKKINDKDYQMASGLFEDININDNIFAITRSRLPWLIIGTIGGIIGAQIIGLFDLKNNLEIAFFIPLIDKLWEVMSEFNHQRLLFKD